MNHTRISLQEFIDSYKQSLGIEGAEQLLKETLVKAGLHHQHDYSKEEALKICRELKQYKGFIGIIGGLLNSRIIIR